MNIQSIDLLGNSSIGIFGLSTESYAIFPYNIQDHKQELIAETLQVPVIPTTINNSNLIGIFAVGNSHSLLVPHLTDPSEIDHLEKSLPDDINVSRLESTITALGNVVLCIKDRALVSPEFSKGERDTIADVLDVEVASRDILSSTIVGSLVFGNTNGILVHPLVSDEDLDWLEDFFKLPVDVVTVNRGTPYPRPGIVGNSRGVLVGSDTTGPELMRIYEVLLSS